MGSQSDWPTMRHAAETLDALASATTTRIVSAHRTPERLYAFAKGAKAAGFKVIIAGAGGAAHLPGMTASLTSLPVFGVPVESKALSGQDSLYSIVQMPPGVPVGTLAIGQAGRDQCGAARRQRAGARTIRRWRAGSTPGGQRRPPPSPRRPKDRRVSVAASRRSARGDHRHPRRRPARPHAGAGRGAARLQVSRLSRRARIRPPSTSCIA